MSNLIQYIPKLQQGFEECRNHEMSSIWMEENAREDMISWISPRKFIIQSLNVDGLGDYPAGCEAFPTGGFSVENKTYELGFRRSKRFCWKRNDEIDTDGVATASNLLRVFRSRHVNPEVEAFRYSKLANYGIASARATTGKTYTDPQIALKDLRANILKITQTGLWRASDLVIIMDLSLKQSIFNLAGNALSNVDADGNLVNLVNSVDGIPVYEVYSDAMKTGYSYNNGFDGEFGFAAAPDAKQVNWIIIAKSAPVAIVRYDEWKAFDPDSDDLADNWRMTYTMYHDLFVYDSDLDSLWVNTQ